MCQHMPYTFSRRLSTLPTAGSRSLVETTTGKVKYERSRLDDINQTTSGTNRNFALPPNPEGVVVAPAPFNIGGVGLKYPG